MWTHQVIEWGVKKGVTKETLPNSISYSITHFRVGGGEGGLGSRSPANFSNLCCDFAANLARRGVLAGIR